jgi:hypothetical protein
MKQEAHVYLRSRSFGVSGTNEKSVLIKLCDNGLKPNQKNYSHGIQKLVKT